MVRADLPAGLQVAQAGHALAELAIADPVRFRHWHARSNNLIVVACADEAELVALAEDGRGAMFTEPDLGGEYTAAAFLPGDAPGLGHLPLALGESARARPTPAF